MKKITKIFYVLLIAVILLTGCTKKDETPVVENKIEKTSYIRLSENASTGYTWEYDLIDDSIFDIESSEYTQPKTDIPIDGAPGYRTFNLVGKKEGTSSVKFNYVSSGEKKKVSNTVIYKIIVDKDLNVIAIQTTN